MGTLLVPFVSQIISGALTHNNDCGPTSALMQARAYNTCLTTTVDQVYDAMQPSGDVAISAGQLQNWLATQGIKNTWKSGLQLHDLFDVLVARKPAILLIHYAVMVDAHLTEKTGFRGAHFIVATGMDIDYVFINDPYRSGWEGNHQPVPIDILMQAWTQSNLDGNPQNCALIPNEGIHDLSVQESKPVVYVIKPTINAIRVREGPSEFTRDMGLVWRGTDIFLINNTPVNGYVPRVGGGFVFLDFIQPKA